MTPAMRELLAQAYAANALYASLHTADPGDTGADELVSAGRQPITWVAGGTDGAVVSLPIPYDIADEVLVTHVGIWSDAVGGVFLDAFPNLVALSPGEYKLQLNFTEY